MTKTIISKILKLESQILLRCDCRGLVQIGQYTYSRLMSRVMMLSIKDSLDE